MNWVDRIVESKAFRIIIKGAYWGCIAMALLILFMIGNFLFKIYILDYRFDDAELHPPIETSINNGQSNSINGRFSEIRKAFFFMKGVRYLNNEAAFSF